VEASDRAASGIAQETWTPSRTDDVESALVHGCPTLAFDRQEPEPCGTPDAGSADGGMLGTCRGGQRCVLAPDGRSVCEDPVTPRAVPLPTDCTTHVGCDDGDFCNGAERCEPTADPMFLDARGCRRYPRVCTPPLTCDAAADACVGGDPMTGAGSCTIAELAPAALPLGEWAAIAIGTDGCAAGTVRPAYFRDASQLAVRGDGSRSTTWLGVDVGPGSRCSGASRPSGARGAAGAGIAALRADPPRGRRRPQALAAWLADGVCRGLDGTAACAAAAPAGVEAIGLWLELPDATSSSIWVNGTGDGMPARLDTQAVGRRVSVASYEGTSGSGYLVAFAAAGGARVQVVPALPDPAPPCGTPPMPPCLATDASSTFPTLVDATERRTTVPLALGTASTIAAAALAGDVSIAVGLERSGRIAVALAWPEAGNVAVAALSLEPSTGALVEGAVVRHAASAPADVQVTHLASGIARPGAVVGGATVGDDEGGGFVVTWLDASGTWAARASDVAGVELAPARLGEAARRPHAFVDAGGRARVVGHVGDRFVAFRALCGAP
jgi:hypothetical protein